MTNFGPTSGDTERVFSRARISKNFSRNRLTPDNHNGNVFMKKKHHCCHKTFGFTSHSYKNLNVNLFFT